MKKYLFFLLAFTLICVSCTTNSSEEFGTMTNEQSVSSYEFMMPIAKQHSAGLDYVYSQLSQKATRSFLTFNKQKVKELAPSIILQFVSNNSVLIDKSKEIPNITPNLTRSNDNVTDTLSYQAMEIYKAFTAKFLSSKSLDEMEEHAKKALDPDSIAPLSEHDKIMLSCVICITLDSYSYWMNPDNYNKWNDLINGQEATTYTRGVAGPPARYWCDAKYMPEVGRIATQDGIGCLSSLTLAGVNPCAWVANGILGSVLSLW